METASNFTNFTNFLTDSSSAMAGEFAFERKLQQEPNSTIPNDRLKLILNRWNGSISIYFENWIEEKGEVLNFSPRLSDPLYGREELDKWINEKAKNAPSIEKIWEITARLPSLTKMLLDDRNNE